MPAFCAITPAWPGNLAPAVAPPDNTVDKSNKNPAGSFAIVRFIAPGFTYLSEKYSPNASAYFSLSCLPGIAFCITPSPKLPRAFAVSTGSIKGVIISLPACKADFGKFCIACCPTSSIESDGGGAGVSVGAPTGTFMYFLIDLSITCGSISSGNSKIVPSGSSASIIVLPLHLVC